MVFYVSDALLAELNSLAPSALRERLPDLFAAIEAADDATRPVVAAVAERAFEGADGLAALLANTPLVTRGLAHTDAGVRTLTLSQLVRLASTAAHIKVLLEHKIPKLIAAAVADADLSVAQRASSFFTACAGGGREPLALILADASTLDALRALTADTTSRSGSVLALRALALFAEMAASGDAQFEAAIVDCGLLRPGLALWRGDDPLVRLNVVELFGTLGRVSSGLRWLAETTGVVDELRETLDAPVGEDMLVDLLRPAVLTCLGTLLDEGGAYASELLLGGPRDLVSQLWPLLSAREAEQHCAALAALRAAAAVPAGYRAILGLHGGAKGESKLSMLQRAADERARVGALLVTAQLVATHAELATAAAAAAAAATASGAPPPPPPPGIEEDATAATGTLEVSLRALVGACSPSPSTSAADALAALAKSLSDAVRLVALRLLGALAGTEWGALELAVSEGTLEVLMTSADVHALSPEELREKHGIAVALMRWPQAPAFLGATAAATIRAYAAAGPFAPQRPRAAVLAAPLTL